jgi:hypothetical protein
MKATDVRVWRRNMADIGVSLNARFALRSFHDRPLRELLEPALAV